VLPGPGKRITKAPYIAAIAEHAQRKHEKRMMKMQQGQQELSPIEEEGDDGQGHQRRREGYLNPNKRQRTGEERKNGVA